MPVNGKTGTSLHLHNLIQCEISFQMCFSLNDSVNEFCVQGRLLSSVFLPGERGIIHLHNLIWLISMVSRKLTMKREILQYIKIFNITVYVDNILRYHHSLSVGIIIQLPKQDHSS